MDEFTARQLAEILSADTWNSGGDLWIVFKRRSDGMVVAFTDESVCLYADEDAMHTGDPEEAIVIV